MSPEELYNKLKNVSAGYGKCIYDLDYCRKIAPIAEEINRLKKETDTVILVHSYVTPDILYTVADHAGDSFELSRKAQQSSAKRILFVAVRFMAETAKILNPEKTVMIPSRLNGCTLADSITGAEVRRLKSENPGFAFACYINTSAEVKAECDVCVTSSNVYDILQKYPSDKIYFLPDKLMGMNVRDELLARGVKKEIRFTDGVCYVHEAYDPEMIDFMKLTHGDVAVLSHPECSPAVLSKSDFSGSTSQLLKYVAASDAKKFLLLTECGLAARLQTEMPDRKFVGSCTMCRYMKSNTLENVLSALKEPAADLTIELNDEISKGARRCLEAMFEYAK